MDGILTPVQSNSGAMFKVIKINEDIFAMTLSVLVESFLEDQRNLQTFDVWQNNEYYANINYTKEQLVEKLKTLV